MTLKFSIWFYRLQVDAKISLSYFIKLNAAVHDLSW